MTVTRFRGRSDEALLTGRFVAIIGGINQGSGVGITFTGVDSTHVRATFSAPVLNNPGIRCVELWSLGPDSAGTPIVVLSVSPEQSPETTSVLLTTTEHLNGGAYTGLLYYLEIA